MSQHKQLHRMGPKIGLKNFWGGGKAEVVTDRNDRSDSIPGSSYGDTLWFEGWIGSLTASSHSAAFYADGVRTPLQDRFSKSMAMTADL